MWSHRWFNFVVVLFWLATMSWLIVAKVIPPLVVGQPPTYRSIVAAEGQTPKGQQSAWVLSWNDREVGWATTETKLGKQELTELLSRVHVGKLALDELMPLRLGSLFDAHGGVLSLDADSTVAIDPLGKLDSFWSRVSLGEWLDLIRVQGSVVGNQMELTVRSGDFVYNTRNYIAADALLGDVLSPQTRLPNLRIGQRWTVPIFSPFRPPNTPMQVLQASVEREEVLIWDNRGVLTNVVQYRSDEGSGLSFSKEPQGRVWVRRDGLVLQQELQVMSSWLRFVRVPEARTAAFIEQLPPQARGTAAPSALK
jgi:hypothetical protein